MNELVKRIIVAFVGVPVALLIIYLGGYVFMAVVAIVSSVALWEFYKIAEKKHAYPNKIPGIIAGLLLMLLFYLRETFFDIVWLLIFLVICIIIILTFELFRNKPNGFLNISSTISGVIYITVSFCCLIGIREFFRLFDSSYIINHTIDIDNNFALSILKKNIYCGWLVASLFISVWIGDSAAYFIGVKWGKHKLFPRISPKKSWEGTVACFIGAIIGFAGATAILIPKFSIIHSVIIGAIIGIIGQIGDLAESLLKRDAGIKDSSAILPGHGGMLDRFDSILFVAPAVYIYLLINFYFPVIGIFLTK